MNKKTYTRRSDQLLQQIQNHPHKDELLNIMLAQMTDSKNTYSISTPSK